MPSLAEAEALADELFETADEVEAMPVVPRARLDRLAADGWYGLSAPPDLDGAGIDITGGWPILAALAGGCLTTTFVWMQHLGVVPATAYGAPHLRERWATKLATGEVRATVAFAGLRPDAPLRASPQGDGWVLEGTAPWVTGWGRCDVVHVAARTPDDDVVWLLVDAVESATLRSERLRLLALDASDTVSLRFAAHRVDLDRETHRFPWAEWPAKDAAGLRTNGSLSLGVARRCLRLLGASALDDELMRVQAALDANDPSTLPAARAAAAAFAHRVATTLVVERGSSSVVTGATAGRLLREATVLLVFGSRPSIRRELLATCAPER